MPVPVCNQTIQASACGLGSRRAQTAGRLRQITIEGYYGSTLSAGDGLTPYNPLNLAPLAELKRLHLAPLDSHPVAPMLQ